MVKMLTVPSQKGAPENVVKISLANSIWARETTSKFNFAVKALLGIKIATENENTNDALRGCEQNNCTIYKRWR